MVSEYKGEWPQIWSSLKRVILLKGEPAAPLADPAEIFWDDLTAANRLKTYLLSVGTDLPKEVEEALAELTANFGSATEVPADSPDAVVGGSPGDANPGGIGRAVF